MRLISRVWAWVKDRCTLSHFTPRPHYLRDVALQFEKWEGTGNDFVLVDGRQEGRLPSVWSDAEIQTLCDRKRGVGSDGVVIVTPVDSGAFHVDFRNPDGSRSFCGNGTRSAVAWANEEFNLTTEVQLDAEDGVHKGCIGPGGTPGISLNVNAVPEVKSVLIQGAMFATYLHTGSPHHIEWLTSRQNMEALDLTNASLPIRHHHDYQPGGCNVSVVVAEEDDLHIRTFERGVEAETLSCGTGVVAAALGDMTRRNVEPGKQTRRVSARGGSLDVEAIRDANGAFREVWLFGAARRVFRGTWSWALAFLALWSDPARAGELTEQLTESAQMSVLTASPGSDLYAAFGHTAIRIFDPASRLDYVFNYGTFVVDEGFYLRFVQGRMNYRLGVERYGRFQNLYLRQGRALHEQVLHLKPDDVKAMAEFLEWNAQPENATYAYDFFRDNCATKVISVFENVFGDRYDAGCLPTDSTYLEALRPYTSGNPWSAWGMELILGAEASTAMPPCGHAFLPDVLAHQLNSMTLDRQPLAFEREVVYPHQGSWHAGLPFGHSGRHAPAMFMWVWAFLMALNWRWKARGLAWQVWMRRGAVLVTGICAALLTTLFTAMALVTEHNDTWWNADLIWSLGGWGVLSVFLFRRRGKGAGDLSLVRYLVAAWTCFALASVLLVPALRSGLGWGEATVWASVGACVAVVFSVWTSLQSEVY